MYDSQCSTLKTVCEYCRDMNRCSTGSAQSDRGFERMTVERGWSGSSLLPDLVLFSPTLCEVFRRFPDECLAPTRVLL